MATYSLASQSQLDYGIESNILRITGKGYNEKGNLDQTRNFAEFPTTSVLGGVLKVLYSGYPTIASSFTSFDFNEENRPVSSSISPISEVSITAAGGGIEIDLSNSPISADQGDVIGIPLLVSSLTPTFNIILEGTTPADTLTLSAVTLTDYGFVINKWGNLTLKLSQFTPTANFTYQNIKKIRITSSAAVVIRAQQIQTANNLACLIGSELSLVFSCVKEIEEDIDRAVELVKCQNTTRDSRATGYEATVSFKALGMSLSHEGYAQGTAVKGGMKRVNRIINGDKGLKNMTITTNQIVSLITVIPRETVVSIDGQVLNRVDSVSLVDDTNYHTTAVGLFTFSSSYNGKIPTITDKTSKFVSYIEDLGIIDSFAFQITSGREIEGNLIAEKLYKKVKFNSIKGAQEDAYVDSEVEMSILIRGGKYMEKYLY